MSDSMADARRELEATRARMSATLEELDTQISERTTRIRQVFDVSQVVEQHPWALLLTAFAAGLAIAGTGTDAQARHAITAGARQGAIRAREAVENYREQRAQDREVALRQEEFADRVTGRDQERGFMARIESELLRVLHVDELLGEMQAASRRLF